MSALPLGPECGSCSAASGIGLARLWFVSSDAPCYPWPSGSATGVGSMPGTDPAQACAVVMGELPEFPFLPELPTRGVGADIVGRTASLLVDLPVETTARGWKFATRPGRDQRRAAGFLSFDLDAMQQAADGCAGFVHSAQIVAGTERAAGAGEDRDADLGVAIGVIERLQ